ncbi:hypothetical protein KSW81_007563 [Nannochloris sp. 'desiccata']|nr:hypothetical protein KSW81_007563 [Chlorella desiccata (nom. nud.)]
MYNGIGITSVRGTGTSGYVQTNKFNLRGPPQQRRDRDDNKGPRHRGPNAAILEHNRKREIEVQVELMRDELEEEGLSEEEIEEKLAAYRAKLIAKAEEEKQQQAVVVAASRSKANDKETHQLAARKAQQMDKLKNAFGFTADIKEGDAFNRELQEQKKLDRIAEREAKEVARLKEWEERERRREKEANRRKKDEKKRRREEEEERRRNKKAKRREEKDIRSRKEEIDTRDIKTGADGEALSPEGNTNRNAKAASAEKEAEVEEGEAPVLTKPAEVAMAPAKKQIEKSSGASPRKHRHDSRGGEAAARAAVVKVVHIQALAPAAIVTALVQAAAVIEEDS